MSAVVCELECRETPRGLVTEVDEDILPNLKNVSFFDKVIADRRGRLWTADGKGWEHLRSRKFARHTFEEYHWCKNLSFTAALETMLAKR